MCMKYSRVESLRCYRHSMRSLNANTSAHANDGIYQCIQVVMLLVYDEVFLLAICLVAAWFRNVVWP